ncbi:hypothetical protein HK405_002930 [Cladochytrium tenue]|nr:hypothetical protein HK405_002930 [Cladochytrium tenue]
MATQAPITASPALLAAAAAATSSVRPVVTLLSCSTRTPRIGPSVSAWVSSAVLAAATEAAGAVLLPVDLSALDLPFNPIPGPIPAHRPTPPPLSGTDGAATKTTGDARVDAWSQLAGASAAFVFCLPQYNWSIPGPFKSALDLLFHEWRDKPILVVSYGGRGGGLSNDALRVIAKGLKMRTCEARVELPLGDGVPRAIQGRLDSDVVARWDAGGKQEELRKGWEELAGMLGLESST